jgi:hypothetical protein
LTAFTTSARGHGCAARNESRASDGGDEAGGDAQRSCRDRLPERRTTDLGASCAERNADGELAGADDDGERHHAIEAATCESEREESEHCGCRGRSPFGDESAVHAVRNVG